MPDEVTFEEAAYTTMGAIALQGIRQADVRLGEVVAVVGLGLIGLLTVQLLKAAGCLVIGLDIDANALDNAKKSGADFVFRSDQENISSSIQSVTQGIGVDAVLITAATRSNQPIEQAGEICRKKGRVVVVGVVGMNIPRNVYYTKELDFRISCSYGPGRYDPNYEEHGIDYPVGYVRWTEKRNMQAFLQMVAEKKVDLSKITTHRFEIEDAKRAYSLIMGKTEEKFIGVLLEYEKAKEILPDITLKSAVPKTAETVNIGVIGAGSFAQATILPFLQKKEAARLVGVLAAESHLSQNVAKKFGFEKCYAQPEDVFADDDIDAVVVATRHDFHTVYTIQGLKNNKHLYVEKPLAIDLDQFREVVKVYGQSDRDVLVGFNRRFAPHIERIGEFFGQRHSPMFISYRINAGYVAPDHWMQNKEEGGGRIIGEVCHFIDLCQFLCRSNYKSVFAQNIGNDDLRDNVAVTLKFKDGSVATVSYLANGDKGFPKERIEIFCENAVAVVNDFSSLHLVRSGKTKIEKGHQDKGHKKQMELWIQNLIEGKGAPVPFDESVNATAATFMVHESLNTGKVIPFDDTMKIFFA
jgi:polar amino acid transport system substrate-binding protein